VGAALDSAMDEARSILRARRHDMPGQPDSFAVEDNQNFLSMWANLSGTFFIAMVAIAAISLVVGGIVIMNIMLASVTERTREIGLRRSLGARKSHIVLQFMTESALLSLIGGLIGLALAYGVVALAKALTPIPMTTPISAVIVALVLSTSVGLFFGIYPATRAAKLDPIEALRADG
jgi:putative ABC transport system permease protein